MSNAFQRLASLYHVLSNFWCANLHYFQNLQLYTIFQSSYRQRLSIGITINMYAFHTNSDSRFPSMPCITAHNCSAVGGAHAPLRGKAAQRMRRRSRRIARFGCAETGARARRPPLSRTSQKRTRYFLRQTEKPAAYKRFRSPLKSTPR